MQSSTLSNIFKFCCLVLPLAASIPLQQLEARDHVVCGANGWGCHQAYFCDNDDSREAGSFVKSCKFRHENHYTNSRVRTPPTLSSASAAASSTTPAYTLLSRRTNSPSIGAPPNIPNPITLPHPNATLNSDGSVSSGTASHKTTRGVSSELLEERQLTSQIQWCDPNSTLWIYINPTTSSASSSIQQLLSFAATQVAGYLKKNASSAIPSTSNPNLEYEVSSGDRADFTNLGSQMTWAQIALMVNLTADYMAHNKYYTGVAIRLFNGIYQVGDPGLGQLEIN